MRNLTLNVVTTLFIFYITGHSFAQENTNKKDNLVWYTDLIKAQEISKFSNKPIFAFFTGSDWCIWCHKLERDVFEKSEFIKWARKNVILLELDFPRKKQLSPELTQQNNSLQQTFLVQGFPTVWMFFLNKDETTSKFDISALGSLGYPNNAEPGREEVKFLENANSILVNKSVK